MTAKKPILVGDIGGTNTRLAIADISCEIEITNFKKFRGDDYTSLYDIIEAYFRGQPVSPVNISLAIAGPIHAGEVQLTNRDWHISSQVLADKFGFSAVDLHNDFAAMSRSALLMKDDSYEVFYDSGTFDPKGAVVVAGPGTGFGMGIVVPHDNAPIVMPSEGGHQAFSPQTDIECALLKELSKTNEFVSLELVTSGSGMNAVHEALCNIHGQSYEMLPPETIREKALAGDPVCLDVCEIRAAGVMGALGDMALAAGAQGGAVLAGGVSERLADFLRAPKAMDRFFRRGPRSDYMKRISIRLLTDAEAPLYGAAALFADSR